MNSIIVEFKGFNLIMYSGENFIIAERKESVTAGVLNAINGALKQSPDVIVVDYTNKIISITLGTKIPTVKNYNFTHLYFAKHNSATNTFELSVISF